ncbi:MAG: TonB-dependent receptor [Saprospiraceae bacterium]|nr:TonB-dependent receptor [Saprospiraceae bacterium]
MYYNYILLFLLMGTSVLSHAQSEHNKLFQIEGRVLNSEFESLSFANVRLINDEKELVLGTSSDFDGKFILKSELENGNYEIIIDYVGTTPYQKSIEIGDALDNKTIDLGNIFLREGHQIAEIQVDQYQSNGNCCSIDFPIQQTSTITSKSIIDPDQLKKINAPNNLVDMISLVSGVEENVACGVCFTNSISINGLPGQYTAVLIDGTPMYGNLASVYGLNGIPNALIDYVEVTKGPNSAMYGSEAVAGVLNIVTKNPKDQALLEINLQGSSHLESFNNLIFSPKIGKNLYTSFGLDHVYMNTYHDENQDGFGDIINLDRISAFGKISLDRPKNRKFSLFAKYYYEDRRNGLEDFVKNRAYRTLRGNDSIYGESIYTKRWEVLGTYDLPTKEFLRLDYSFSGHNQDSYYGSDHYVAQQYIAFTNINWRKFIKKHDISVGGTFRYQYYDDNTVATEDSLNISNAHQFIPGIYVEDTWEISKKFAVLLGTRLDYYQEHGLIPAPRLNIRYKPSTWTTLRLNMGTGFRVVNLFAEDHAFVTGNRQLEIQEDLQPERSYNISGQFSQIINVGKGFGSLNLEGFYTHFTNAIFPDYSEANKLIYKNLDAFAQTAGFNLSYDHQFSFPLTLSFAGGWRYSAQTEREDGGQLVSNRLELAPFWNGSFMIGYHIKKWQLSFAYSGNITGEMELPTVFDLDTDGNPLPNARPTRSKPFSIQTFQVNKGFEKINLTLYAGIQNVLNYRQSLSPLAGYNDPNANPGFSDYFDTAYAYSSIHGREFYLGIRWFLNRKNM